MRSTSPAPGRLLALSEVPDPVFSRGILAPGFAGDITFGTITAPISGTIVVIAPKTLHAFGIRGLNDGEVLVDAHAAAEDVVHAGDVLVVQSR